VLLRPELAQYSCNQVQSAKPIPEQSPVIAGVHDIILSWDLEHGWMKLRIEDAWWCSNGGVWFFKELLTRGSVTVLGTNTEVGRIHLRGMATSDGEVLTLHRDPKAEFHPLVEGLKLDKTFNRMCYFREQKVWRLRDEEKTAEYAKNGWDLQSPDLLKLVNSYEGDGKLSWAYSDQFAHIYHEGPVIISDEDNIAHLYDPDEVYS